VQQWVPRRCRVSPCLALQAACALIGNLARTHSFSTVLRFAAPVASLCLQRGFLPRGVILSNADLDLLKAFDRNRDGLLDPEELELAQAAFRAFDPNPQPATDSGAAEPSRGPTSALPSGSGEGSVAGGRPPVPSHGRPAAAGERGSGSAAGEPAGVAAAMGYGGRGSTGADSRRGSGGVGATLSDPFSHGAGGGGRAGAGSRPGSGSYGGAPGAAASSLSLAGTSALAPSSSARGSSAGGGAAAGTSGLLPGPGSSFFGPQRR